VVNVPEVPKWAMPWLLPTGTVTLAALRALDRPLLAWPNGEFDAEEYYEGFPASEISALERDIRKLGMRPTWRMERVWFPDDEASAEETAAYEAACRDVAGRLIMPRCLDAYVMQAYAAAGLGDGEDPADVDIDDEDLDEALAWAEAAVCVLQQSLPWPFTDCLPYSELDNRPAHRILYACASLLSRRHPRKAAPFFRAMVYYNPPNNMGARFAAPGGRRS
jgi:hypothetical protein